MSPPAALTMRLPSTTTPITGRDRPSGGTSRVLSPSRHTRTVPSSPPLTTTGVPSARTPAATARTLPSWPRNGSPTGRRGQPPHPHRPVGAAADHHRGPVRQHPRRHRGHRCRRGRAAAPRPGAAASRHTRTVPSLLPLTTTGVPSASTPTATASTAAVDGRAAAPRPELPSASRHTRTVPSWPPLTTTGVPSASNPTATADTRRRGRQRLPDRAAVGQPPHPHRPVTAAADHHRGPVRHTPTATAATSPLWPR